MELHGASRWLGFGLAGLMVAVALGLGAYAVSRDSVGLSATSVRSSGRLAPDEARAPGRGRGRGRGGDDVRRGDAPKEDRSGRRENRREDDDGAKTPSAGDTSSRSGSGSSGSDSGSSGSGDDADGSGSGSDSGGGSSGSGGGGKSGSGGDSDDD